MLLEQSVTNALFRPVRGQARGLGYVEDFDSVVDFVDDGEFRLLAGAVHHFPGLK